MLVRLSYRLPKSLLLLTAATFLAGVPGIVGHVSAVAARPVPQDAESADTQDKTESTEPSNPTEFRELIQEDYDQARALMEKWIARDDRMASMATSLMASFHASKQEYDEAAKLLKSCFDQYYQKVSEADEASLAHLSQLNNLARSFNAYAGRSKDYAEEATSLMAKAIDLQLSRLEKADGPNVLTNSTISMVSYFQQMDDSEDAKQAMDRLTTVINKWLEADPDSEQVNISKLQLVAASDRAPEEVMELAKSIKDKFPESSPVFRSYTGVVMGLVSSNVRSNPEVAAEMLKSLEDEIESADFLQDRDKQILSTNIARTRSQIEPALTRMNLVGQPAPEFDSEAWVNGEATTLRDLRGKVVLIDFWAVWCGPCIATFPHLREWNEDYGDKGLVIVGVTSKYDYSWDEDAERAVRGEEHSMDEELAMLEKFLEHHELEHRSMVTPEGTSMSKEYGVSGIPQAVLIDKQGTVRLIKVGSGQANADALHEMIEQLLDE